MKKLKKFYQNNRIYCILMLVSIFCFILIGAGVVTYFVRQAMLDSYGKRLESIEKYDTKEDLNNLKDFFKQDNVIESSIRIQGKIIYIEVSVKKETKISDIENMATSSLEKIKADNLSYYDIQFIFQREGEIPYMGAKSSSNQLISWNNYNINTEESGDKK